MDYTYQNREKGDKCMHINIPITHVTTVREYYFKLHESMDMDMRVFVFVCMSTNVCVYKCV